jgi:hypothetical protein
LTEALLLAGLLVVATAARAMRLLLSSALVGCGVALAGSAVKAYPGRGPLIALAYAGFGFACAAIGIAIIRSGAVSLAVAAMGAGAALTVGGLAMVRDTGVLLGLAVVAGARNFLRHEKVFRQWSFFGSCEQLGRGLPGMMGGASAVLQGVIVISSRQFMLGLTLVAFGLAVIGIGAAVLLTRRTAHERGPVNAYWLTCLFDGLPATAKIASWRRHEPLAATRCTSPRRSASPPNPPCATPRPSGRSAPSSHRPT